MRHYWEPRGEPTDCAEPSDVDDAQPVPWTETDDRGRRARALHRAVLDLTLAEVNWAADRRVTGWDPEPARRRFWQAARAYARALADWHERYGGEL